MYYGCASWRVVCVSQTLVQSATSNVWAGVKGHPASELERSLAEGFQSDVVTWNGEWGRGA